MDTKNNTYTVQSGDTLYKIANTFDMTVDELIQINHLHNTVLTIGQILQLENPFPTPLHIGEDICGPTLPSEENSSVENYSLYTVKNGDTLYQIANQFHTSIGNLRYINNLKNNVLMIGQILKIPQSQENLYTVKIGDSLWSIAEEYKTTVSELQKVNNLSSTSLKIGQKLILPKPLLSPTTEENTYIVKSGDSLYSIAQQFSTTTNFLIKRNELQNNLLMIGQKLIVR